jgi:hypothetical protein
VRRRRARAYGMLQWCYSDFTVVSQWCDSGVWCDSAVTVVRLWCDIGVTVVLQWCDNGVTVVSQWCNSDSTSASSSTCHLSLATAPCCTAISRWRDRRLDSRPARVIGVGQQGRRRVYSPHNQEVHTLSLSPSLFQFLSLYLGCVA